MCDSNGGFIMIKLTNVSKIYRKGKEKIYALEDLSLSLNSGDFCIIHGGSGSGKSTLLMTAGAMMQPEMGTVEYNNENIYKMSARKRNQLRRTALGFIFQKFYLLPYLDIYNNIKVTASLNNIPDTDRKIREIAEEMGLSDRLTHLPSELSVGQQQRVATARSLVYNPDVILADEPTGNLDETNRDIIISRLKEETKRGTIIIMVTHDESLLKNANITVELREGKILTKKEN